MSLKALHRKSVRIANSRWTTYAVAGAATSLAGLATADAEIHYSGPVNFQFKGTLSHNFPLDNGASLHFHHFNLGSGGGANLAISSDALFAGPQSYSDEAFFVYRLRSHVNVSQQHLGHSCFRFSSSSGSSTVTYCFGGIIERLTDGYFGQPGKGYIGFQFNTGAGRQYGWVRVKTSGASENNFVVLDYAWADPNETIQTGQKRSRVNEQALTKAGSLGLLATGAIGLKAWRQHRGSEKAALRSSSAR